MSEQERIERILAGHGSDFGALVEEYLPMVRGICLSHAYDASAVDDLVQEVFVAGYTKLNTLRDRRKFAPWLARIARNICTTWVRTSKRRGEIHRELAETASPATSTLSDVARRDLYDWLGAQMRELPAKTHEAMVLRYVEGYSIAEVARFLGASDSAIKKRLQYGRELMGQRLFDEFGEKASSIDTDDESTRLKARVLAALPIGSAAWETVAVVGGGAAVGTSVVSLQTAAVCAVVLTVGAAVTAWQFWSPTPQTAAPPNPPVQIDQRAAADDDSVDASMRSEATPSIPDAVASASATASDTGSILIRARYDEANIGVDERGTPVVGAVVRIAPTTFARDEFYDLLEAADIPRAHHDLMAASFGERRIDREERNAALAEAGLTQDELSASFQQLMAKHTELSANKRMISLQEFNRPAGPSQWRDAMTNDEGEALFTDLPPGRYMGRVFFAGQDTTDQGPIAGDIETHNSGWTTFVEPDTLNEQLVVVREAPRFIAGRVIDKATGKPVAHVRMHVSGDAFGEEQRYVPVDEDGFFAVPPSSSPRSGTFIIEGERENFEPLTYEGFKEIGTPLDLVIEMTKKPHVWGYVHTADGEPAQWVSVMRAQLDGSGAQGQCNTDEDGYYEFPHGGGLFKLNASGGTVSTDVVEFTLAPDATHRQDFVLPPTSRVVFDIRDHNNEIPEKIERTEIHKENSGWSGDRLKRVGDEFVLPHVGPGQYDLWLRVKGFDGVSMKLDIPAAMETYRYRIRLEPIESKFTVRVVDQDGDPMHKAHVSLMRIRVRYDDRGRQRGSSGHGVDSGTTDENGLITFIGHSPGTYEIYGARSERIELPYEGVYTVVGDPPHPTPPSALHIDRKKLFLIARDGTRLPIGETDGIFAVNQSGEVSRGRLHAGRSTVFVIKSGYPMASMEVDITQAMIDERTPDEGMAYNMDDIELRLPEGGRIYGEAFHDDGRPRVATEVKIVPAGIGHLAPSEFDSDWYALGRSMAQGVKVDDDGIFVIDYLSPGDYVLQMGNDDHWSEPIRVEAGHETGPVQILSER